QTSRQIIGDRNCFKRAATAVVRYAKVIDTICADRETASVRFRQRQINNAGWNLPVDDRSIYSRSVRAAIGWNRIEEIERQHIRVAERISSLHEEASSGCSQKLVVVECECGRGAGMIDCQLCCGRVLVLERDVIKLRQFSTI